VLFLFLLFVSGEVTWTRDTSEIVPLVSGIMDMVVTPDGEVYFLDGRESVIHHLDASGAHIGAFGRAGEGPGEFRWTSQLVSFGEEPVIGVLDIQKDAIHRFTRDGLFHSSMTFPGDISHTPLRVLDKSRFVYVDAHHPNSSDFEPNRGAAFVSASFADAGDETVFYRHDSHDHADPGIVTSKDTTSIFGLAWMPESLLDVSRDGLIAVGTTRGVDIRIFEPDELEQVAEISDPEIGARILTEDELETYRRGAVVAGKRYPYFGQEKPEVAAPLASMRFDGLGRLWVRLSKPRDQALPERYRIYEPNKGLIATLALESGERVYWADADAMWLVRTEGGADERILVEKRAYTLEK